MTPETVISPTPAAGTDSPSQPAAAAPDAAALQRQIDELSEQVKESQRTAEFWAERARQSAPQPAPQPEPEPDDDDTDVLEAITTKGAKGFDELAAKRGFVRRNDVAAMIEQRATALTKEQELIARYPDLKVKNSEFFKATAAHYGELVKGGTPPTLAMELASEKTELDFMRSGKLKPEAPKDDRGDREERRARAAAQAGPSSRRPAATEPDDDELNDQQKRIADAMGVSHEAYLKRAKAGVNIGGRPGARR
jgi:hypothetical protein